MKKLTSSKVTTISKSKKLYLILVVIAAILAILIIAKIAKQVTNQEQTQVRTQMQELSFDGKNIHLYKNEGIAFENALSDIKAEAHKIETTNKADISSTAAIEKCKDGSYAIDLSGLQRQQILVTVKIGGDGSKVGEIFEKGVKTYYFAINVSDSEGESLYEANLSTPTGQIWFGDDRFPTYSTEISAQSAVAKDSASFTIPTFMAQELTISCKDHSPNTARIWVKVCMVDSKGVNRQAVRLNADNEWSTKLNLSEFFGHQVTLMIKTEDSMAFNRGYSYVSFILPTIPTEETS